MLDTYLTQNPRGIWEIRWTEKGEDGRSRSQRHSTRQTTEDAAKAYQAAWAKARVTQLDVLATPTVAEVLDAYLVDCRGRGVRDSHGWVLRPVRAALGALRPRDLSGGPLGEYRRRRTLGGVAATSLARELGALTAALNWAAHTEKGGMIGREDVPMILKPVAPRVERRWLDEDEEAEFHKLALAWPRTRVRLYVALGLNTGMRREAIEQLTWDRVDLAAGLIDFRVPGERVTKKRRVPAPINMRLRPVLEAVPEGLRWGRVVGDATMRSSYDPFRRSTPWPWVSSHIMRHTFVTLNLRAGLTIHQVAALVGDTEVIIGRHYGHHQADWHLKAAANKRFEVGAGAAP